MLDMMTLEQEHLKVVILDTQNHVLKIHTAYIGSLNTAVVPWATLPRGDPPQRGRHHRLSQPS